MEKLQQLYSKNGEKCTQGSGGECTSRWIKKPHAQVTNPNEITTQSRRPQLSLDNPKIHNCHWKSTSESSLTNWYSTWRSRNGLVIGRAMTYNRGMTVPELNPTPTASNHRTRSAARKHLGAHLPAENRSWRLVDECTLEEITSSVNKQLEKSQPDETTSELRDWRCGYPAQWLQAHLEIEGKAYPKESWRAQPAIGDKCTEHRADVKCTYKCTDLEDDQCDCKSTGAIMRRSSSLDLCRMSTIMSTEAVPNETENDLRTYQIVYRTAPRAIHRNASREIVTERHHERQ